MNSLRAVKMFCIKKAPGGRQRLDSDGVGDKVEDNHSSTDSDTSSYNLEAGFVKIGKNKKPGLGSKFTEYTHRQKTSFINWSCSQPRSVWASMISAILGIVTIWYVCLLYYHCWRYATEKES